MNYDMIVPVKKVDGSEVKTVTVKESFTGRDIRAIGNCKGEGDAMIELVVAATGLSTNDVLGMVSLPALSWPVARPRLRRWLCGACWCFPLVL